MLPKKVVLFFLLLFTVANACDFDLLMETLYDDYTSDEDETSTAKPNATTPQGSQSSASSSTSESSNAPRSTTQPTSTSSQAPPQTNSAAPSSARSPKARRHRKTRKHVTGKILQEGKLMEMTRDSRLYANVNPSLHRYASKYSDADNYEHADEKIKATGRSLQPVFDKDKANDDDGNKDESSLRSIFDKLFGPLQYHEQDEETGRSSSSNESILLKLLMAEMERNANILKKKRKHQLQQKEKRIETNKKLFDFFLKLLENSLKHDHNENKNDSGISQHVFILMSNDKNKEDLKKEDKLGEEMKCKTVNDNVVTCIKDQTIYETIKLNPKENSGFRKTEESIRYSTIKDNSKIKESMDHVFKGKNPYSEHESLEEYGHYSDPYHTNRPYNNRPHDDEYVIDKDRHHRRPYIDTSNRFNPEDKEKLEDQEKTDGTTKMEEMSSVSAKESTTFMPVTQKS
ncbi:hypothetical protein RN001_000255 [Aquatica leii]|uniref:Uncharacterized protein n=1 Tax=Aquatica leii TaxID=1421715 RepID=A0AAN7Q2S7_9COLE|nr:hypothetical protein RN001_000255 [Aquatica leii]